MIRPKTFKGGLCNEKREEKPRYTRLIPKFRFGENTLTPIRPDKRPIPKGSVFLGCVPGSLEPRTVRTKPGAFEGLSAFWPNRWRRFRYRSVFAKICQNGSVLIAISAARDRDGCTIPEESGFLRPLPPSVRLDSARNPSTWTTSDSRNRRWSRSSLFPDSSSGAESRSNPIRSGRES